MKELSHRIILYVTIVSLIAIIFMQRSCAPQIEKYNSRQEVVVPKKEGDFSKPVTIIKRSVIRKDSIIWKDKIIKTENPINKKLAEDYIKAQKERDSLKALNLYLKAIEEKEETYVFNNKDLKLEIDTKTRGSILSIKPKYEIKEREQVVPVKQKETKFALYTGASLEYITSLEKLTPKASIGIQNSKGSILSVEMGLDKSVQIGYSVRLINIKR